jgi:hypothetical protein
VWLAPHYKDLYTVLHSCTVTICYSWVNTKQRMTATFIAKNSNHLNGVILHFSVFARLYIWLSALTYCTKQSE